MTAEPAITVLLVEDSAAEAELVADALTFARRTRFEVRPVTRLAEAVTALGAMPVDVVVLDLGLPDATGLDAVRGIRGAAPGVAIVVRSGMSDERIALEALEAGVQDYVLKGASDQQLERAILFALARRQADESSHRLAALVESSDDAIISTDRDGTISSFNPGAVNLYGYSADEAIGRPLSALAPPGYAEETGELQARALAGGVSRIETVRVRRDGRHVDVAMTVSPILDAAGGIVGVSGIASDISARKELQAEVTAARDLFAGVLDAATETAIIGTDPDGLITVFNRGAERMLGRTAPEMVGRETPISFHDPAEVAARALELGIEPGFEVLVRAARAGESETREWSYLRPDGARLTVSLTVSAISQDDGEVRGFIGLARDVTAMRRAEIGRRGAEERFKAAFEQAPIGVALVGMRGSDRGRFIQTNAALAKMLGRAPGELDGMLIADVAHPDDQSRIGAAQAVVDRGDTVQIETRYMHRDGRPIWAVVSSTPLFDEQGEPPTCCVTQVLDISERKQFESQLHYLADHDALTGLCNRRRFETELDRILAESRRFRRRGALLMLDLDGFKVINDRFGHPVGDELVTRIAAMLNQSVRNTDLVARLGGDEFAVLLQECDEADAVVIADKILDTIRRRGIVIYELHKSRVTTSIGITTFDGGCELTSAELVVEADIAMYDAKAAGRNRYSIYDRAANRRGVISKRHSWLERLTHAVEEDLFELHAQPIVGICSNGIPRYELLLRMRTDDGDLIPPGAFLYNAERFDMMGEIDRWVMRQAIKTLHDCSVRGQDVSLSMNLSGKTMNDLHLASDLAAMLAEHPIPPERLIVEVTETAAIVNIERARELAVELRKLGCRFALDDFGSGFASFYYLKYLDFDYLKIDGEFIKKLVSTHTDQLVVKALVEIARGLGTKTVAEFVGDDATVEMLRTLGVDYGQGYHLGRPGPIPEQLDRFGTAAGSTRREGT